MAGGRVEVIADARFVSRRVAALQASACPVDWAHSDLWEAAIAPHCRSGAAPRRTPTPFRRVGAA
eukprot:6264729-Pyramimonas_sp.AAC.1